MMRGRPGVASSSAPPDGHNIDLTPPRGFTYRVCPWSKATSASLCDTTVLHNTSRTHILLIGDSIDRIICSDWCIQSAAARNRRLVTFEAKWNDGTLRYKDGPSSMSLCYNEHGDSLAHVHHFGSHPYGPYFSKMSRVRNDSDP